jgi:hypothetical protein
VAVGDLDVAERDSGVESGRDVGVPEGVAPDLVLDPGPLGEAVHDPGRGVAVHPLPARSPDQRHLGAVSDGLVQGSSHRDWQRDHRVKQSPCVL